MTHSAHIELVRVNKSGQIEGLAVSVNYGPNKAQIEIAPGQPVPGETPEIQAFALRLQELGTALLHIADTPGAITSHPAHRK